MLFHKHTPTDGRTDGQTTGLLELLRAAKKEGPKEEAKLGARVTGPWGPVRGTEVSTIIDINLGPNERTHAGNHKDRKHRYIMIGRTHGQKQVQLRGSQSGV